MLGKEFSSYEALNEFIQSFQKENDIQLWKRRSILLSPKLISKRAKRAKKELRYYSLQYSCVHGGLQFKSKGTGIRERRSVKKGCPFAIRILVSKDGGSLKVVSYLSTHNHDTDNPLFKASPPKRRRQRSEERLIGDIENLQPNKKLVKKYTKANTRKKDKIYLKTMDASEKIRLLTTKLSQFPSIFETFDTIDFLNALVKIDEFAELAKTRSGGFITFDPKTPTDE